MNILSLDEIEKYRVVSPNVSSLLIRFPNGWPRTGVFCCLQVFLIQRLGWKIVLKDQKPKLVAQNCIKLSPPKSAARVTLIDSFAYIEVHVNYSSELVLCQQTVKRIRENILNGISAACKTLRYKDEDLELGFFCPCSATSASSASASVSVGNRHPAEFIEKDCCIRCTIDEDYSKIASTEHTVWFGKL